jgi:uncharacterized protein YcfJ
MNGTVKTLIGVVALAAATYASAELTVYQGEGFRGHAVTASSGIRDLNNSPLGRVGRSVVVASGNWEVCDGPNFTGNCVMLQEGSYDSVNGMPLQYGIASVRSADPRRYYRTILPPAAEPTYEYRQRPHERIHEVPVLAVHAVVGPPEQRCWVERERVVEREPANAGGAIAGAIIGGIVGHQLSHGDNAGTVGGAAAGAAIGSQVGRDSNVYDQNVQHCAIVPPGPPDFWDVTYEFRGYQHHVQMTAPPGRTIMVNDEGEPRG